MNNELYNLVKAAIDISKIKLETKTPEVVYNNLEKSKSFTNELKKIVGEKTHGQYYNSSIYFNSSFKRYTHYFSICMTLKKPSKILDIGNAPGHVAIGLHLLGHEIKGINISDAWDPTYPSYAWIKEFSAIPLDIEKNKLPFEDNTFNAVLFTEVLEHIAITDPFNILKEIYRVLKKDGIIICSTPNVCNISNIIALLNGTNIFWKSEIFYGSIDRHNREYTPEEVNTLFQKANFREIYMYGFNCDSNWRAGTENFIGDILNVFGEDHPLLKNTIMIYGYK